MLCAGGPGAFVPRVCQALRWGAAQHRLATKFMCPEVQGLKGGDLSLCALYALWVKYSQIL